METSSNSLTIEEEILICEQKLMEALLKGDIEVLDKLLHEELIFNIPTGQTITKSMDLENYRSGIMTVNEITASDRIINIIEDIATVAVTLHLKAQYADQCIDGRFRYLRVWKTFDNSWKVIAGSGFQIPSG
ncbi:MAG: nuclear transport factor 2 family protein [Pyrinomonadaceae bacterium]|nr:nuclear transport factor 2 family protein [Sphingobacteriaceae bacterium]